MTIESPISRRAFVRGAALGAGSLVLGACVPPAATPSTSGSPTAPVATKAPATSASPTSAPSPGSTPAVVPLRQRIARLLIVGFQGLTITPDDPIARAIAEQDLGGVILFDRHRGTAQPRNIESPEQVTQLIADLRALAPHRELIVAIDQEGGLVTRLSPKYGFPAVASEASIGNAGDSAVQAWAEGIAGTLAAVGVNLNFAPVVDLNINPGNPAVGALDRAFSGDPAVVSRDAEIELEAHRARDVKTALKHFPGLGSATANTDFGVADVTATWRDVELDPYRDLLGLGLVDVVMAAHVVNGQVDPNAPASLSRATVTDLLRTRLGWDGVVITDDLQASAIREAFGFEDAIALAIEAGNDLLLFANQQVFDADLTTSVVDMIEGLVAQGRITEARIDASVERVARLFSAGGAIGD